MARAFLTLLLALLVSTIVATPIKSLKKRTFKVERIHNRNYVPDGKRAMKRAYLKFGLGDIESKPNSEVADRVKAASNNSGNSTGSENGETSATGTQNDAQFLSPITVGGQQIVVDFDTGSSDLWVFNTNLPASSQKNHIVYNPKKSTTSKASQNKFDISYGDGSSCSGPVGFDTVDIGGSTVENQAIGLPNVVSPSFVQDPNNNGLVGLAFSTLNTVKPQQQKTFFDNVAADLSAPLFTAALKGGTVGAYEFGQIDQTAFQGELKNASVDNSLGFWQFSSTKLVVENTVHEIQGGQAIADTGTSLMLVKNTTAAAYYSHVKGGQFDNTTASWIFPCASQLPSMQVAVGDQMAVVDGVNMNFATAGVDNNGQTSKLTHNHLPCSSTDTLLHSVFWRHASH